MPGFRRWSDRLFFLATGFCALIAVGVLLSIVFGILFRGLPAIDWDFLTREMEQVGLSGGILYNVAGTIILITTAAAFCGPIAIGLALTQTVYLRRERARRALALLLYVLNGVPAILFGLFGLIVFVNFLDLGKSWLTGGVLLGLMVLPTVTVALVERIKALPARYVEAAAGLGLKRSQIVRSVILPQSVGGLVTGLMLGLARAAGETAPIMFTACIFSGVTLPKGIKESPVLSLPFHIFNLAQDHPGATSKMWGTAAVLLTLVFTLSLIALPLRLRVHEEARGS